jgi:hypothetical protein
MNRAWWVLGVALLAGCGAGKATDDEALHSAAGAALVAQGNGEIRILGVNGAAFTSVSMNVKSVEVRANGKVLTSVLQTTQIELANATQAWLLAKFAVPADATQLEVKFSLEDGGSFAGTAKTAGHIHAPCSEIRFVVDVSQLNLRGHAVCHVDLEKSLVRHAGEVAEFVPNWSLHY